MKKLEWLEGLPDYDKRLRICLLVLTKYANMTNGQLPHDGRGCAMHIIAWQSELQV